MWLRWSGALPSGEPHDIPKHLSICFNSVAFGVLLINAISSRFFDTLLSSEDLEIIQKADAIALLEEN